ncbi:hypothetical protein Pyn_17210 [Prunus yedoensis var. nudiflora]|uniref:Uncharacterized protein n=1 Tax=Prunus yedoensis var. nudiflora TaxID=2094558 RepID=A0A314XIY7_PRUYE|nr:hypothetical protein Pyn_38444 [Prunus yedoensis var. nudiflora]PQP93872.1 hypothetical protein Pyn_17210 [Prunus yedoensis var. nudiflora]
MFKDGLSIHQFIAMSMPDHAMEREMQMLMMKDTTMTCEQDQLQAIRMATLSKQRDWRNVWLR